MVKFVDQTISKWLNALLGGFVEEINADSINVAMLAGKARLENLTVKPTCLQELGLPVILNKGTVGRIELDIPMSALKSKPICVTVRDVLISVSPNPQVDLKRVLRPLIHGDAVQQVQRLANKLPSRRVCAQLLTQTVEFRGPVRQGHRVGRARQLRHRLRDLRHLVLQETLI